LGVAARTGEGRRELWTGAGLVDVETREITVERTFADFDDYWTTVRLGPSVGPPLAAMCCAPTCTRVRAPVVRSRIEITGVAL